MNKIWFSKVTPPANQTKAAQEPIILLYTLILTPPRKHKLYIDFLHSIKCTRNRGEAKKKKKKKEKGSVYDVSREIICVSTIQNFQKPTTSSDYSANGSKGSF